VIKFFMAITPEEQLRRFEQRLNDPYKQWKLTEADVRARANWDEYVEATDEMFDRTHTHRAPWHLIGGDNKTRARESVLTLATERLRVHRVWMEKKARELEVRSLRTELERLERRNHR
jgi:polyphosphate kinase 2 (PPK2 family)